MPVNQIQITENTKQHKRDGEAHTVRSELSDSIRPLSVCRVGNNCGGCCYRYKLVKKPDIAVFQARPGLIVLNFSVFMFFMPAFTQTEE